jgi:RNA polymerase sigma-70 factor (ECF subfamily)
MSDTPPPETRLSLLARLGDAADQQAWVEFDRRYRPVVLAWCRRWRLQEADAEEVTQRVLARLVAKMRECAYDPAAGRFRAWLKTLAWHALSDLRKEQARPGGGSGDSQAQSLLGDVEARADLEARLEEQFDLDLLEEARARVRQRVAAATWEAYRLTAEEGLSALEVSRRTGLDVDQVHVAKSRVLRLLQEEVRRLRG